MDRGGAYFVAAAAPGYAPAGAEVRADADAALPALVLRGGVAITGSVRSGGAPAPGAAVRASLPEGIGFTLSLGLDGNALAFDAGGVVWRSLAAEADVLGAFRISGLSARTYRVEVEALLGGEAPRAGALEVAAPGVAEFDVPVARVFVTARGAGMPLAGASVVLYSKLPGQEDGNVTFVVEEGAGVWAPKPQEVVRALTRWISRPEEKQKVIENCRRAGKPEAARTIAKMIGEMLGL